MAVKTQLAGKSGVLPVAHTFVLHHDSGLTGHKALILETTLESVGASKPAFYADLRALGRSSKVQFVLHSGASSSGPQLGTVIQHRKMFSYTFDMTFTHAQRPIVVEKGDAMSGREKLVTLPSAPGGPARHLWKGTKDYGFSHWVHGHLKLVNQLTGQEVAVFERSAGKQGDGHLYICLDGISDAYLIEIVASFLAIAEQEFRSRRNNGVAGAGAVTG